MAATLAHHRRRHAVSATRLARAASRALRALGRPRSRVEILVVGDGEIRRLNAAWRGVRRRTDVLAFPLEVADAPAALVGQIVISVDTARRQARKGGVPLASELDLLVTHGVLHAIGYDDRDSVEAGLMHAREREILSAGGRRPPARLWRGLLA
jgi:rRNA maturation RNase YbeY